MSATDDLREYVDWLYEHRQMAGLDHGVLLDIADRIDAEHARRMDDCRREVRREVIRYVRGVLTDLDRGVRRVRKGDKTEVVRCRDCESAVESHYHDGLVCCMHGIHVDGSHFCSDGERREVEE